MRKTYLADNESGSLGSRDSGRSGWPAGPLAKSIFDCYYCENNLHLSHLAPQWLMAHHPKWLPGARVGGRLRGFNGGLHGHLTGAPAWRTSRLARGTRCDPSPAGVQYSWPLARPVRNAGQGHFGESMGAPPR